MDVTVARGKRARMRRSRAGALLLKATVFLAGAACIALGLLLVVLPGPLTIPPVLLGVYLWSTEFAWAERMRDMAMVQARVAWEAAKGRPIHTVVATVAGLGLAGVALYAAPRAEVLEPIPGARA